MFARRYCRSGGRHHAVLSDEPWPGPGAGGTTSRVRVLRRGPRASSRWRVCVRQNPRGDRSVRSRADERLARGSLIFRPWPGSTGCCRKELDGLKIVLSSTSATEHSCSQNQCMDEECSALLGRAGSHAGHFHAIGRSSLRPGDRSAAITCLLSDRYARFEARVDGRGRPGSARPTVRPASRCSRARPKTVPWRRIQVKSN